MSIVTIILLIVLAVLAFLVRVEAIPLRKWIYACRIKVIGMKSRLLLEFLDFLDRMERWIDRLLG